MITLEYSLKRISSVLEEIERLKESEFPYKSSQLALKILEGRFKRHQVRLRGLIRQKRTPTQFVADNACRISLSDIYKYLPILGFVLRSTSTRNAFETYGPIHRLVQQILKPSAKLILSSEWEYAPYVYSKIILLPDFVLIGLPAQEAENPLLISLAGHEVGHSVWAENNILIKYQSQIEKKVINEITTNFWEEHKELFPGRTKKSIREKDQDVKYTWIPAYESARKQMEEIFCDFIGLRIFAESYLYAFSYLLSPCLGGKRKLYYPNLKRRIDHIIEGADNFGVIVPENYVDCFEDQIEPIEPRLKFFVKVADKIVAEFVTELIREVDDITRTRNTPMRSHEEVNKLKINLENLIPIENANSLADILNSAWICFHNEKLWKKNPMIKSHDKTRILYDLVLKSIEVFEIEKRIG